MTTWSAKQNHTNLSVSSFSNTSLKALGQQTFKWNVWCNDTLGNSAWGINWTFTTDMNAPTNANITNTSITNDSARINWVTTELANSSVKWGLNSTNLNNSNGSSTREIQHNITISGLLNYTLYFYNAKSSPVFFNLIGM